MPDPKYDADAWNAIRTQLDNYTDPRPDWMRSCPSGS